MHPYRNLLLNGTILSVFDSLVILLLPFHVVDVAFNCHFLLPRIIHRVLSYEVSYTEKLCVEAAYVDAAFLPSLAVINAESNAMLRGDCELPILEN